jgi:hypothetical protein
LHILSAWRHRTHGDARWKYLIQQSGSQKLPMVQLQISMFLVEAGPLMSKYRQSDLPCGAFHPLGWFGSASSGYVKLHHFA